MKSPLFQIPTESSLSMDNKIVFRVLIYRCMRMFIRNSTTFNAECIYFFLTIYTQICEHKFIVATFFHVSLQINLNFKYLARVYNIWQKMPLSIFFFSDSLGLHLTCKHSHNLYEGKVPQNLSPY